jgi:hypothetical protein
MRHIARVLAALAVLVAGAGSLSAQVQTGSILVRTIDEQAGVMPGVTITITSPVLVSGQMTGVTDAGGAYRFPSLPPGTYAVRTELSGFQAVIREGLTVSVGQTTSLEFTMRLAGVTESVTVTGASPVVDTTRVNVGVNLDAKLLETTPSGRDIWSVIEYKVPGLVMASPDVGGNQGGLQRGISARGTGNAQNTQMLNGVNVGDPAAIGFAGYYYDPSSFQDIQVSSGAQDITVPSGGVFINMVTKSGTNQFASQALFTYQGDKTQSQNVDEELQAQGLRPNANAVDFITNANFNAGGPLVRNKLFYFGALNDQRTHVNVVGFPAIPTDGIQNEPTDITSGLGKLTYQLNDAHRFSGEGSRQLYNKPNRGASNTNTPESTFHERDVLAVYQGLWNWVISNQMFMDTRVSYNSIDFPLQLKTDQQTLLDNTTNIRTRAAANEAVMFRERLQTSANFNWFIPQAAGGRHEIRAGIDNAYTPDSVQTIINDDLRLTYRSAPQGTNPAGPVQVQLFNTPIFAKRAVQTTALYVQDAYAYKRLTFTAGVRWERVEGWLPEQSSPPSRWFPEGTVFTTNIRGVPTQYTVRRSFPEQRNIPLWKNAGPRVSAVYDVTGDGRTALRLSVARYYDQIGTGTPGGFNPNGQIQQNFVWNDRNGDLLFQDGELGNPSAPTVPASNERDPDLQRPYRNEFTAGLDRELFPGFGVSVTWIQRREKNPLTNIDIGIPFDYYRQEDRVDPGRDGVVGTTDDGVITIYNELTPARVSVLQLTNDDRVAQRYKGLDLSATKRSSDNWQMIAGYTWSRTEVEATGVTNPNDAFVNARGRAGIDRTHNFKLTGSALLPYDVQIGGNFRLQSGEPITRTVSITGLVQNPNGVTVLAEPRGSTLLPWLHTVDFRIGKIFRFGGPQLELDMDIYNVTNANTVYAVRTNSDLINVRRGGDGETLRIPQFLSPTNVLGPRIVRFNVTYKFGR